MAISGRRAAIRSSSVVSRVANSCAPGRMHFQGREAGIDRMPAINGRHTGNRHIGVADHLEFLKSMARQDVFERAIPLGIAAASRTRLAASSIALAIQNSDSAPPNVLALTL